MFETLIRSIILVGVRILNATPEKYLFRSPYTKQRTPSGVLFALAGALVICRGGVSPPVYNGLIFGRGDPSPTEGAERANFRRRRIPCAAKTAEAYLQTNAPPPYKCGQSRTPVPTDFVCDSPP